MHREGGSRNRDGSFNDRQRHNIGQKVSRPTDNSYGYRKATGENEPQRLQPQTRSNNALNKDYYNNKSRGLEPNNEEYIYTGNDERDILNSDRRLGGNIHDRGHHQKRFDEDISPRGNSNFGFSLDHRLIVNQKINPTKSSEILRRHSDRIVKVYPEPTRTKAEGFRRRPEEGETSFIRRDLDNKTEKYDLPTPGHHRQVYRENPLFEDDEEQRSDNEDVYTPPHSNRGPGTSFMRTDYGSERFNREDSDQIDHRLQPSNSSRRPQPSNSPRRPHRNSESRAIEALDNAISTADYSGNNPLPDPRMNIRSQDRPVHTRSIHIPEDIRSHEIDLSTKVSASGGSMIPEEFTIYAPAASHRPVHTTSSHIPEDIRSHEIGLSTKVSASGGSMIPEEFTIYNPVASNRPTPETSEIDVHVTTVSSSKCSVLLLIISATLVLADAISDGYMNYTISNWTCVTNSQLENRFNFNMSLLEICVEKRESMELIVRIVFSLGSLLSLLQLVNIIIIIVHRISSTTFPGMSGLAELHIVMWCREIPQVLLALFISYPCSCGTQSRYILSSVIISAFIVCWFRFISSFRTCGGTSGFMNMWWRCLCCKETSRDIKDIAKDGKGKGACDIPCVFCCSTLHLQTSRCRVRCWCFDLMKYLPCMSTCCDKDRNRYGLRLMNLVGLSLLTMAVGAQIVVLE